MDIIPAATFELTMNNQMELRRSMLRVVSMKSRKGALIEWAKLSGLERLLMVCVLAAPKAMDSMLSERENRPGERPRMESDNPVVPV
jgi:hypothetical protein